MKKSMMIVISALSAAVITAASAVPLTIYFYNRSGILIEYGKIKEIEKEISSNFLYDIDRDKFNDAVAQGIITGLEDGYASYYNPNQYEERKEESEGIHTESGIKYVRDPDSNYLYVYFISEQSPAAKAGVKEGDRIVKIESADVREMRDDDIYAKMNSKVGTKLSLALQRGNAPVAVSFTFAQFEVDSVKWKKMGDVGYIQITHFDGATPKQFKAAIEALNKLAVKGLVFDLRNNLGGNVAAVSEILDQLVPKGPLVTVQYKDGSKKVTDRSDANEIKLPMAVIMNENTASASEIFVMNIRDYNKGKLVGTKSYGKGIIQTTYALSDKTAVKFTVAKIVNQAGEAYHEKGFTPDVEVTLSEEQSKYFEMMKKEDDPQIAAAIETLGIK